MIINYLKEIITLLSENNIQRKELFDFETACQYLGVSDSHLYKLTSQKKIPFYQPTGKKVYFKKSEIDEWISKSRIFDEAEIESLANQYLINQKFKKGGFYAVS